MNTKTVSRKTKQGGQDKHGIIIEKTNEENIRMKAAEIPIHQWEAAIQELKAALGFLTECHHPTMRSLRGEFERRQVKGQNSV